MFDEPRVRELELRATWIIFSLAVGILTCILWPNFELHSGANRLSPKEALGKRLFFEEGMSDPKGQSCATCHDPASGFADPDSDFATSNGVLGWVFGPRNAPTASYASFVPQLQYNEDFGVYFGGLFVDGRVGTLAEQAERPFLNPLEMHNYNKWLVIENLVNSGHAPAFKRVYGRRSLIVKTDADADRVLAQIGDAIAAYESSSQVNKFNSRFDKYLIGEMTLTPRQKRGLDLFNGKAGCFGCHPSTVNGNDPAPLFTNHTYHNLGTPKNWSSPWLYMPEDINPFGEHFVDLGLGNTVAEFYPEGAEWEDGKFRTPTLRNVAKTAPYGHNGVFATLKDIVHFYNTRDVPEAGWDPPEVHRNMNTRIGNLGLTDAEEDDIVAFLHTLSDR